jgi:hypothetical protein
MTLSGQQHFEAAELLIDGAGKASAADQAAMMATAQVHATLALAAATLVAAPQPRPLSTRIAGWAA